MLCAGLMTPHECPTVGLLPSECALRARMPSEARADGERWRPSVRRSGEVGRPAPNTGSRSGEVGRPAPTLGAAPARSGDLRRTLGAAPARSGDLRRTLGAAPARSGDLRRTLGALNKKTLCEARHSGPRLVGAVDGNGHACRCERAPAGSIGASSARRGRSIHCLGNRDSLGRSSCQ